MDTLHVNWTRTDRWKVAMLRCPTCKRRRRMLAQFQEYYGWRTTCLTCGESWEDGEMLARPFEPGWRRKSVAHARKRLAILRAEKEEKP